MSRSNAVAAVILGIALLVLLGAGVLSVGLIGAAGGRTTAALPAVRTSGAPAPAPGQAPVAASPSPLPRGYDHVVVIVMENHSLESVLGSPEAPFLNSFAVANSLSTGYTGVSHPSLPNYLALVGGTTFGVSSDCTGCFQPGPSIADRIEASGRTWNAYQEGMPSPCFIGSSGRYSQKHDPFIYFDSIRRNPGRCARIVPYSQMGVDFASAVAPSFAFVTPDLCNDGHDCPLSAGDSWLAQQVPSIMSSAAFAGSRSLLVVTFDEGEGGSDRVLTVLAGSGVRTGYRSTAAYDHYSLYCGPSRTSGTWPRWRRGTGRPPP